MSELVSVREFARQIGCSDVAVHKAIKAGKIVHGYVRVAKNKYKINPEVAATEWGKHFNPNYERSPNIREKIGANPPPPPSQDIDKPSGTRSLAEVKRLNAEVKLQLDAIELKRKKGELVDKRAVYAALYEAGQTIKNQVLGVADRTIDEILAAPSRNDAHTILLKALVEALETLADTNAIKLPD
jgi:hypothetical protein